MNSEFEGARESTHRRFRFRSETQIDRLKRLVYEADSKNAVIKVLSRIGQSAGEARDRGDSSLEGALYQLKYETLVHLIHMKAAGVPGITIEMRKLETEDGEVDRLHFILERPGLRLPYVTRTKLDDLATYAGQSPENLLRMIVRLGRQ